MIHLGTDLQTKKEIEIPVHHSGVYYMIGFLEGEGGFTWYKDKDSQYPTPGVHFTNTDKTPLLYIQKTLKELGVHSIIYSHDWKQDKRKSWQSITPRKRIYQLRVVNRLNCLKFARLIDEKLIAQEKKIQFDKWYKAMIVREAQILENRVKIERRNKEIIERVTKGESPLAIARELGFNRTSLYVMLGRKGLTVNKLRGVQF